MMDRPGAGVKQEDFVCGVPGEVYAGRFGSRPRLV